MIRSCTLLLIVLTTLWAGDPGPISLKFYSVTPSWRNKTQDIAKLQSKLFRAGVGFDAEDNKVFVTRTFPGSAAQKSGLQKADTILSVNGTPVLTVDDFKQSCESTNKAALNLEVKRGNQILPISVIRSMEDPLYYKLAYWAEDEYNAYISYGTASEEEQQIIEEKAFTASKGFRTEDAHKRLKGHFPEETLIMIRGGKRILFILPGWSTVCVKVSDYDGDLLTSARLEKLWSRIVGKYDNWRYANP